MSIYGTWLSIEHPDQWKADMEKHGIKAGVIGDDTPQRELGSPWVYKGSHVLPQRSDPRGGSIDVAAIPAFIERDGQDGGGEGEPKDWLRLSVDADEHTYGSGGGYAVVVLDREQVIALATTLNLWLNRDPEEG